MLVYYNKKLSFCQLYDILSQGLKGGNSMVYLDYSATTPVSDDVLNTFVRVSKEYVGNSNSLHKLGVDSKRLMDSSSKQVANLLNVKASEIIFTSSSSEANNMAIVGTVLKYMDRGKHIIKTKLEHSSVLESVNYLQSLGYEISYVDVLNNGLIDLDDLKRKLRKDTVLVSISHVNSEVGFCKEIAKIVKIVKSNYQTILHVDGTQAIGKTKVNLKDIDLYTFSAHKIYGLKGVACLVKKEKILMEPLIHGGKSQTIYRSGTPAVALYASLSKALRICLENYDENIKKVEKMYDRLMLGLKKLPVFINSNEFCVPHIVNISVLGIKPETLLHEFEKNEIYISTKTACSTSSSASLAIQAVYNDNARASHSIRISLSHLTTEAEIDFFLEKLEEAITKLCFIKN